MFDDPNELLEEIDSPLEEGFESGGAPLDGESSENPVEESVAFMDEDLEGLKATYSDMPDAEGMMAYEEQVQMGPDERQNEMAEMLTERFADRRSRSNEFQEGASRMSAQYGL
jgi:hypothetical protein